MATKSQGIEIRMDIASTMTKIANISGFSGLQGGTSAIIDTTTFDSAAKEKLVGLQDEGSVSFDLKFENEATYQALQAARAGQALSDFEIALPASESGDVAITASFSGYVTSLPVGGAIDGIIESSATVEITGAITWA